MEPIHPKYATGKEAFLVSGKDRELSLLDFWAWAYSDCLTNTSRGVLAEFLVAAALGLDLKEPRKAWAKYDLTYRGKGIEVKSASYHQAWYQKAMSRISYSIPATRSWDENTNRLEDHATRDAFVYVLALLSEKIRERVNPLNLDQWCFWVVPTSFFNLRTRSQTSITYRSLLREVGEAVPFSRIKSEVDKLIDAG